MGKDHIIVGVQGVESVYGAGELRESGSGVKGKSERLFQLGLTEGARHQFKWISSMAERARNASDRAIILLPILA